MMASIPAHKVYISNLWGILGLLSMVSLDYFLKCPLFVIMYRHEKVSIVKNSPLVKLMVFVLYWNL